MLALAFFSLQMDRGNISAVLTSTITKDLNITTNQINVGTQLLSAGIVLSEIPSNIIMQRIGPRVWLSGQLFAWGIVATFQAFVKSYPAFLVTRILLGFCEGGFIPGKCTNQQHFDPMELTWELAAVQVPCTTYRPGIKRMRPVFEQVCSSMGRCLPRQHQA